MKQKDVQVGGTYTVKVSGTLVPVKLLNESPYGGWNGVNITTGRAVRIRTAARLRKVNTLFPQPAQSKICPGHDANTDCEIDPQNPCDACNKAEDAAEQRKRCFPVPPKQSNLQELILDRLSSQYFADWYNTGHFAQWIQGDLPKVTKETVLEEITKMFKLD